MSPLLSHPFTIMPHDGKSHSSASNHACIVFVGKYCSHWLFIHHSRDLYSVVLLRSCRSKGIGSELEFGNWWIEYFLFALCSPRCWYYSIPMTSLMHTVISRNNTVPYWQVTWRQGDGPLGLFCSIFSHLSITIVSSLVLLDLFFLTDTRHWFEFVLYDVKRATVELWRHHRIEPFHFWYLDWPYFLFPFSINSQLPDPIIFSIPIIKPSAVICHLSSIVNCLSPIIFSGLASTDSYSVHSDELELSS